MAGRIKGITVEIGGDTTGLEKALKGVNSAIKTTQSELKDVERLLKLDPSNTELLTQKQKLLKDAISSTSEKLETLKEAQKQAKEQLERGELGQDKYDALQREIIETEQELRRLQEQAASTSVSLEKLAEAGEKFEKAGDSITNVGKKVSVASAAVTGLGVAAVKTAADFDSAMANVAAISGATGDDLQALRDKARDMGEKTKFSASEAAEAMSYMSVPQIARRLEADGFKTKRGSEAWRPNAVLGILKNEKYSGNAILGKTYKPDVLSKRRIRNDGTIAPMYYAENTHPAIISKELFNLAQYEIQRRKDEKDIAVGGSRYTSKYPFSGLLVCGCCGHRLRRHVRTMGNGKKVATWGCANRITNGRAVCESRHVSEDILKEAYRAAINDAVGNMDAIIKTVKDSCQMVLVSDNHEALAEVERQLIKLQEEVLDFHRARQGYAVTEAEYKAQIDAYTDQMQPLEARRSELQSTSNKYTAVQHWLDTFKETATTGDIYDPDNATVMKAMVEYIVVHRDRLEIHLKCRVTIEKEYV